MLVVVDVLDNDVLVAFVVVVVVVVAVAAAVASTSSLGAEPDAH